MTKPIAEVLKEHADVLMALPGVNGIAQGEKDGETCVLILVVELTNDLMRQIPDDLEGYPVVITETGEFKAL
ncbi:MAG: hypothetical protein IH960_08585 [Chloroflexi bacterium]|nr:hypothetical protein [Chloroflexota bacterium]